MKLLLKDAKYVGRDTAAIPIEIVSSQGSHLITSDGMKYIDFVMGWCVGNIGWGVPEVEKVIADFNGPDYVNPFYLYKPWAEPRRLRSRYKRRWHIPEERNSFQ